MRFVCLFLLFKNKIKLGNVECFYLIGGEVLGEIYRLKNQSFGNHQNEMVLVNFWVT